MNFNITCRAFEPGATIPRVHTCDGDDTSPPLRWESTPKATVSLAILMEDPDAPGGSFTHWIMYNIPADIAMLEKIVPIQKNLSNGAHQGINDFGKVGYRGPCPPSGEEHRYIFRIYALNKKLPPESASDAAQFRQNIADHIIDTAEYMGKYKRS